MEVCLLRAPGGGVSTKSTWWRCVYYRAPGGGVSTKSTWWRCVYYRAPAGGVSTIEHLVEVCLPEHLVEVSGLDDCSKKESTTHTLK